MADGAPRDRGPARPELRTRVTRRTHEEMVRRAAAAGMSLADYTRAVIVNTILEPDDRARAFEHMQSEIERLQAIVDGLRTESEELAALRKERGQLHRKIARLEPLAAVAKAMINAVKNGAALAQGDNDDDS